MTCELTCGSTCCGCHAGWYSDGRKHAICEYHCMKCDAPAPEHFRPCDPLAHNYNKHGHIRGCGSESCFSCGKPYDMWGDDPRWT